MPDLEAFADNIADGAPGFPLERAGPTTRRLTQFVREEVARSLIATAFWESFVNSPALLRTSRRLGLGPGALIQSEKILVYRSRLDRFDLVCFASVGEGGGKPLTEVVDPDPMELMSGWQHLYGGRRLDSWTLTSRGPLLGIEALQVSCPFSIIVVPPVHTEGTKPPNPCHEIKAGSSSSTAGIVAQDNAGRDGVTAALHAVGSTTSVTVGSMAGTVVTTDVVSDSCFVEMSSPPRPSSRGALGPMKTTLPRGNQSASFDGFTSRSKTTTIIGWSLELPNATTQSQSKVYTKKDTNPGDSGAALITDDDYIVGFAFERSAYSSPIDFSSWIWADLVFRALDLVYPP